MSVISITGENLSEVSPAIRESINNYWRTVETREDLQKAWQDLHVQSPSTKPCIR